MEESFIQVEEISGGETQLGVEHPNRDQLQMTCFFIQTPFPIVLIPNLMNINGSLVRLKSLLTKEIRIQKFTSL